ncbi:Multidrug+resistance+protein+MexA [Methylocapsa aurea]
MIATRHRVPSSPPIVMNPEAWVSRAAARGLFGGIFALLSMAVAASCEQALAAEPARPPAQAGYVVVHLQPITRVTELPGRTNAVLTAEVRPQVNGVVLKRLFEEGSEVKEGQQLYQIDPALYQAAYDSAVATLARNRATYQAANAKAARYKALSSMKAVSKQDVEDAVATAQQAEADIAIAQASISQARINLSYTKVLAPISGRIGRSTVTPGALVIANQSNVLATVTQLDPIYVDVTQSATTLLRLRKALASGEIESIGRGAAKVTLKLEDNSTYDVAGKLQFSEVTVDEGTGTVLMRAIFPNPKHLLLPGMYVHASLQEGVDRNGVLIPQQAVSRNTHGDATVLLLADDNKASLRIIQTGQAIGDRWIVIGGLRAGERVIVDGLQNIRPGDLVQPIAVEDAAIRADKRS